ncbi:Plastid division protein PDV1-like protein [Drosera capensis]
MESEEEIEAEMEKIWDLHDKLSDVIHSISRAHFINSIKNNKNKKNSYGNGVNEIGNGFVYVKESEKEKEEVVVEARSLHGIRAALEDLEEQLEVLHSVQMQQRAERDAALARLEQSRIILALRLREHHGKRYEVIEEALNFVGDVKGGTCFISPKDLSAPPPGAPGEGTLLQTRSLSLLTRVLLSGLGCAKDALKWDVVGRVVGHAALFAVTMLAMAHFQQASCKEKCNLCKPSKRIPQVIGILKVIDLMLLDPTSPGKSAESSFPLNPLKEQEDLEQTGRRYPESTRSHALP